MVKLVYVIRLRSDLGVDEARRYWREEHAPKVAGVAEAIRAVRYVQSHTLDTPINEALLEPRGGMSPWFEGITEVWWNSLEDLAEAAGTDEGQAAMAMLVEDESGFIDFDRSTIFMTEEIEVFDRRAA